MYEPSPDTTELWQGDVISRIHLPSYTFTSTTFSHAFREDGTPEYKGQSTSGAKISKAIVLSQCCEFTEEKRHWFSVAELIEFRDFTEQVTAFNLAPLIPLDKTGVKFPSYEELLQSNVVAPDRHNDLVNGYVYDRDGNHLAQPHIVDFTRVTSLSMKDKGYVLKRKILQLDEAHRKEFKRKLAFFYLRPA